MKATSKFKRRINQVFDTYFDEPETGELAKSEDSRFGMPDGTNDAARQSWFSRYREVLKQAILYFPATFLLYHWSAGFTYFILAGLFSFFSPALLMSFFAAAFFTIVGLGDIRNPKHIAIPFSIILVGIPMGLIMAIFEYPMNPDTYSLLFLPFALMAGILAKALVDGSPTVK